MQITAFARGLMSFLGAYDQGQGIRVLRDDLQATVDTTKFLGATQRRYASGTSLNPSTGGLSVTGPAVTPADNKQVWQCLWMGFRVVSDATGVLVGGTVEYQPSGGSAPMPLCPSINLNVNLNASIGFEMNGLLLLPGDFIQLKPNSQSPNVTWTWGLLYDIVSTGA